LTLSVGLPFLALSVIAWIRGRVLVSEIFAVVAALLLLAALVMSAPMALAEVPFPANPSPCDGAPDPPCIPATSFADYLFLPPGTLPDDYTGGNVWKYSSGKSGDPQIDANAQELFGVRGPSVDKAWQLTTGRPDVVLAILDSGIMWRDGTRTASFDWVPQSK